MWCEINTNYQEKKIDKHIKKNLKTFDIQLWFPIGMVNTLNIIYIAETVIGIVVDTYMDTFL